MDTLDEPQKLQISDSMRKRFSVDDAIRDAANNCGKMDQQSFGEMLFHLFAMTGKKDMPGPRVVRGWYLALRDLDESQFMLAIDRYIREKSKEFLSPQLIIELSGVTVSGDAAPVAAWDEVIAEIKRVGGYQTPKFSDARTSATIRHLGGWVRVCDTDPEELHKWTRQAFVKAFSAMPATAQAKLSNLIESENARTGQTAAAGEIQRRIQNDQRLRIA